MSKKDKIKVLHYVPFMHKTSGITQLIYNFWTNIDQNKFSFNILHHNWRSDLYDDSLSFVEKFNKLNINVYSITDIRENYLQHKKEIVDFFEEHKNEYDIVHCHTISSTYPFIKIAKNYGVPVRIFHSHNSRSSEYMSHRLRNIPILYKANKCATHFLACSEDAGRCLFGNRDFTVINNGVNIKEYEFNKGCREKYINEFGLNDEVFVVGASGRLCVEKNWTFLIEIFEEVHKKHNNSMLIVAGDGPEKENLQNYINSKNLKNCVMLLGDRKDMSALYSVFNVFVMTSFYEGVPLVGIEAQAAGLPCFFSEGISKEVDISKSSYFIPLKENPSVWSNYICYEINKKHNREEIDNVVNSNYSSKVSTQKLTKFYYDAVRNF